MGIEEIDADIPSLLVEEKVRKGKCFSKVNRGQRIGSDGYQTPYSMTQQGIDVFCIEKSKRILEPACGEGAIVKVLMDNGYVSVSSYDIDQRKEGADVRVSSFNFFNENEKYDVIITNPPFKIATDFIIKASTVCLERTFFLMPLVYLHGKERFDKIFLKGIDGFKLKHVYIFVRMPMLSPEIREDGKYPTGMQVYAWFEFVNCGYSKLPKNRLPTFSWIDNSPYVLRKKDLILDVVTERDVQC
jgi:hypothetical protein